MGYQRRVHGAPGYGAADTAVALEEQYDESYDYGQYGEGGYDDGSGMMDPATGLPMQAADGNKDIDALVEQKIRRMEDCSYQCTECDYSSKTKHCMKIHIESKHIISGGYICPDCGKHTPTRNALKVHQKRNHPFGFLGNLKS